METLEEKLVGKQFRYKSKYGLSDWVGVISKVGYSHTIIQDENRDNISLGGIGYEVRIMVKSKSNYNHYYLDEIIILR